MAWAAHLPDTRQSVSQSPKLAKDCLGKNEMAKIIISQIVELSWQNGLEYLMTKCTEMYAYLHSMID